MLWDACKLPGKQTAPEDWQHRLGQLLFMVSCAVLGLVLQAPVISSAVTLCASPWRSIHLRLSDNDELDFLPLVVLSLISVLISVSLISDTNVLWK